jgi:hypothetical protein
LPDVAAIRIPRSREDLSKGVAIGSGIYIDEHTHIEAVRCPSGSDTMSLLTTLLTGGVRDSWANARNTSRSASWRPMFMLAKSLEGRSRDLLHIAGRLTLFDVSKDGKVLMANEAQRQEVYGRRMSQEKEVDLSWFDWTLGRSRPAFGPSCIASLRSKQGGKKTHFA